MTRVFHRAGGAYRVPLAALRAGVLAGLLAVAAMLVMVAAALPAYARSLDDGVYQVDAKVLRAGSDDRSVADASISSPLTLVVDGGKGHLVADIKPVESAGLTGYLGFLGYFPTQHGSTLPSDAEPVAALPQAYYDVEDGFNASAATADPAMRGMKYPNRVAFEVDTAYEQVWIQVYVPLVEGLMSGSGTQRARLVVDYDSARPLADAGQAAQARAAAEADVRAAATGRSLLYSRVYQASMQLLQTATYTDASLQQLRSARDAAQAVCENAGADGRETMSAMLALMDAQGKLQKQGGSSSGGSGGSSSGSKGKDAGKGSSSARGGTGKSGTAASWASKAQKLDFSKLPDGTYTLYGEMVKTDRKSQSISDGAIDHNVRIRVKGGRYTVELRFKTLNLSGKTGALGRLWYFKNGYGTNASGAPTGSYASGKVLSYLALGDGKTYPRTVSFPLISRARGDGWVPLRLYVPVIESISLGAGVQEAYLKLDRSTLVSGQKSVAEARAANAGGSNAQGGAAAIAGGSGASGSGNAGGGEGSLASLLGGTGAESDAGGHAGSGASGSDGAAASDGSGAAGASAAGAAGASQGDAAQEPPLKRYVGLLIGVPALLVCLYCLWVLFMHRRQIGILRVRGRHA